jgi:hypothetical protein
MKYFTKKLKISNTMKKLFIVLAVASLGFVACNNEGTAEKAADSTAAVIDSTAGAMKDSVKATADTMVNKIDSAATAAKDSVKAPK